MGPEQLLPSVAVEHQTRVDDADHANDHEDCDWIHEESPLGLKTAVSHLVIVLLMAHENDALKNTKLSTAAWAVWMTRTALLSGDI